MSESDPPRSAKDVMAEIARLKKSRGAVSVTPVQIRAARVLLGWNDASQLATAAGLGVVTVRRFEQFGQGSDLAKMAIVEALEAAGIEFLPRGVQLREPKA